jgi:hypothetical protein
MAAAYSPWRRFLRKTMVNSVVNSDPPQAISDAKSRLVMACGEWPRSIIRPAAASESANANASGEAGWDYCGYSGLASSGLTASGRHNGHSRRDACLIMPAAHSAMPTRREAAPPKIRATPPRQDDIVPRNHRELERTAPLCVLLVCIMARWITPQLLKRPSGCGDARSLQPDQDRPASSQMPRAPEPGSSAGSPDESRWPACRRRGSAGSN